MSDEPVRITINGHTFKARLIEIKYKDKEDHDNPGDLLRANSMADIAGTISGTCTPSDKAHDELMDFFSQMQIRELQRRMIEASRLLTVLSTGGAE